MSSPDRRPPTPDREMSAFEKASLTENYIHAFREALKEQPGYQKAAAERALNPYGYRDIPVNFRVGRTIYTVDYTSGRSRRDVDDREIHHERLVIDRKAYEEDDTRIELDFNKMHEDYLDSSAKYFPNYTRDSANPKQFTNTDAFPKIDKVLQRLKNPIHG